MIFIELCGDGHAEKVYCRRLRGHHLRMFSAGIALSAVQRPRNDTYFSIPTGERGNELMCQAGGILRPDFVRFRMTPFVRGNDVRRTADGLGTHYTIIN